MTMRYYTYLAYAGRRKEAKVMAEVRSARSNAQQLELTTHSCDKFRVS